MKASTTPALVNTTLERAPERTSTRANLALVAAMPISFVLTVLAIVALTR